MVCVPCFIIPALLFLWHRFVQPYVLRYWNPWAVKDEAGNLTKPEDTKFPFACVGGVCKFSGRGQPGESPAETLEPQVATSADVDKSKAE